MRAVRHTATLRTLTFSHPDFRLPSTAGMPHPLGTTPPRDHRGTVPMRVVLPT